MNMGLLPDHQGLGKLQVSDRGGLGLQQCVCLPLGLGYIRQHLLNCGVLAEDGAALAATAGVIVGQDRAMLVDAAGYADQCPGISRNNGGIIFRLESSCPAVLCGMPYAT